MNAVLSSIPEAVGAFNSHYISPEVSELHLEQGAFSMYFLCSSSSERSSVQQLQRFKVLFSVFKAHARKSNPEADSCSTLQTGRLSNV